MEWCRNCNAPLPPNTMSCPRCGGDVGGGPGSDQTRMESAADIRRWVEHVSGGAAQSQSPAVAPSPATAFPPPPSPPSRAAPSPQAVAVSAGDTARPFVPQHRPPTALLLVVDDGSDGGQWIRLRMAETIVGRTDADVAIPHDEAISSRHLRIYRTLLHGRWQWRVKDLGSTNGTYRRIRSSPLEHRQEILVGTRRFRFDQDPSRAAVGESEYDPPNATRAWKLGAILPAGPAATLVELLPSGDGRRFLLGQSEQWIGSAAKPGAVVIADDPYVSPMHARLVRDLQGGWSIHDGPSRNGTWLRIDEAVVDAVAEFQIGEQRLVLRTSPEAAPGGA